MVKASDGMISGGKKSLDLVVYVMTVIITLLILGSVGLFIGGSLETASQQAQFSTEIQTGFTTVIGDFIANLTGLNSPVVFFITLVLVIMVIAVFAYFIKGSGSDKGGGMDNY